MDYIFIVDSYILCIGINKGNIKNFIVLFLGKVLNFIEYDCKCIMMYLLKIFCMFCDYD